MKDRKQELGAVFERLLPHLKEGGFAIVGGVAIRHNMISRGYDYPLRDFNYLDLIKLHQVNTKPNHFLYFPTCMPGHFIVNRGLIRELNFNYEQEEHSARKELREMLETKELFKRNAVDIPTQAFSPPLLV